MAKKKLRSGKPDWILLKRGDVFNDAFGSLKVTGGRSNQEPLYFGAYGSGPRPQIRTGGGDGLALPLLYAGSIAWVIGYDTIYALQDIEDDALVGVKSSARAMGTQVRAGVALCYATALLLWAGALWTVRPDPLVFVALVPAALHLTGQVATLEPANGGDALAKFRSNRFAGLLVFAAMLVVGSAG